MLIVEILQHLQLALIAMLIGAVAFTLLMIAAYLQEELEYHPEMMEWYSEMMDKLKTLKKTLIAEYPMLYAEPKPVRKSKHRAKHAAPVEQNIFEEGFAQFARGFDRNGGLLNREVRNPSSTLTMASSYLQLSELASPLS